MFIEKISERFLLIFSSWEFIMFAKPLIQLGRHLCGINRDASDFNRGWQMGVMNEEGNIKWKN